MTIDEAIKIITSMDWSKFSDEEISAINILVLNLISVERENLYLRDKLKEINIISKEN